ncbi:PRC-barrel domain-containing protein [Propylenella binzhouense]|uniref:PRC-barrel domain containing protein n=1 Tax=Propylenella binzhouense TaxID=2555902 RepID=A0A964WSN7_9HYPH|nr:PRC-barrel domain-containing protein [Propylenella binzhouense]MYZ47164.1 PRC-barrel domain containing protein [Propylenella binzhouense]
MNADVAVDETRNLISADKVEGTYVFDSEGEQLGHIKTIMLNKLNGRVAYAVLSTGGFLGLGTDYYPLPWEILRYDTDLGGYVVSVRRDMLDGAPHYPADQEPDWADRLFGEAVRGYYGAPGAAA